MPGAAKSVNEGLPFLHRIALSQPDVLADRELLETLLRPLAPPDQCSTLAESLLVREGSFRGVFECNIDTLSDTVGPSIAHHLRCMNAVVRRVLLSDVKERPLVNCWHGRGEYEGSGIGLAIAKKIVERHSGQIWFTSQQGFGTTFFFSMPADGGGAQT